MLDPDLRQRHSDALGKAGFSSSERAPQQEGMEPWAQENGHHLWGSFEEEHQQEYRML